MFEVGRILVSTESVSLISQEDRQMNKTEKWGKIVNGGQTDKMLSSARPYPVDGKHAESKFSICKRVKGIICVQ